MARVVYDPSHPNRQQSGARAGHGRNFATWIFCEREADGEGLFSYYILEGDLRVTTVAPDGQAVTAHLEPGDAHAVRLGQAHYGVAGPEGARFIVVAVSSAP
jgi:hypothetical protein